MFSEKKVTVTFSGGREKLAVSTFHPLADGFRKDKFWTPSLYLKAEQSKFAFTTSLYKRAQIQWKPLQTRILDPGL